MLPAFPLFASNTFSFQQWLFSPPFHCFSAGYMKKFRVIFSFSNAWCWIVLREDVSIHRTKFFFANFGWLAAVCLMHADISSWNVSAKRREKTDKKPSKTRGVSILVGGGEGKITPHGKVVNKASIVLRVLSISLRNVRRSHQPVHPRLLYPKSCGYRVDSTPVFKQRRNLAGT